MAVNFRLANKSDLCELAQMRLAHKTAEGAGGTNPTEFSTHFKQAIDRRIGHDLQVFLLEKCGEIMACAYGVLVHKIPKPSDYHSQFLYLTGVYCKPEYRGGRGQQLIDSVKKWALENEIEFIITWPSKESETLYQHKGFVASEALEAEIKPYAN